MPEEILFQIVHEYDTRESGIVLLTLLRFGEDEAKVRAKLDTGSQFCVFERKQGERLGLEIETGYPLQMTTATGPFQTYGH